MAYNKERTEEAANSIKKKSNGTEIRVDSPGLIISTSRGIIPHLTQDHVAQMNAIKWVHVPFETFLERDPPLPTIVKGEKPLQTLIGLQDDRHVLSMSLRDPHDAREMPPNGNKFANANCIRGVRKMRPEQYRFLIQSCNPDLVIALSDIPFTPPPFSQRRITKSLERSTSWLASLLYPTPGVMANRQHPSNIFVHMVGDVNDSARRAFASSLKETLYGKEAEQIKTFKCLDDAVLGYVFDLVPLRTSLLASGKPAVDEDRPVPILIRQTNDFKPLTEPRSEEIVPRVEDLLHSSLDPLSPEKPRLVTGTSSPHEVLYLIRDVGIDLFDAAWAQKAADWGVALDFVFPVPKERNMGGGTVREDGKRDLGHNLYSAQYAVDFSRLSDCFVDGASQTDNAIHTCSCIACSPTPPPSQLVHASVDVLMRDPLGNGEGQQTVQYDPPISRAYIHHLLHTHEMSAHALLAAHNLAITDAFFKAIRIMLARGSSHAHDTHVHTHKVERFCATYDGALRIFGEAKRDWIAVDHARGKGRLAREKAKQGEENLGTKPEIIAETDEAGN
ncbi:uncharacterized protein FOMMEDRAFT_141186 [Fomitiporia mediterranea MF3/22]|uniref:uncharacterized protein n=1 Tax=Fomitiporia mediterranea (strain MF3/22) TaxID=694068 RepID=UPI0004409542|nr:uncharacterized protein FOMMEDRAFT_141186 [Fomitiporia mediterranea MF3/22]EJD01988.1 hypothetical protein FOMMEDRAFT_141186 [Fomitiporia mediterranea MF3/22]